MPYPYIHIPNLSDYIDRYLAGESAKDLAAEIGVSDSTFRARLLERDIKIRPGTWYPRDMNPCWDAARGRTAAPHEIKKRVTTTEGDLRFSSKHEDRFAPCLDALGISYERQKAILDRYNVDFALTEVPVVVEVIGGGYNPRVRANLPKRREDILDGGWHLIEVYIAKASHQRHLPMTGAAEYVVTFSNSVGLDPSAPREHRMIRTDGEPRSSRRPYLDRAA